MSAMSEQGHVVARIGKPHGLRGEVTVQLHTDDPQTRLADGAVLPTRAEPGSGVPRELTVAGTRVHRGIWLLRFAEIPDRTGAESLRGTRLLAPTDDAQPDDTRPGDAQDQDVEDGWYEEDLVGLRALDPGGVVLGKVTALEVGAAQDRLVLRLTDGAEALVPFVQAIVPTVDTAAGTVTIDAPPGLLDPDAAER